MKPLSEEKKLALNTIRDEHLVDHGHWIFYLINMVIEHAKPHNIAEAVILLNRLFLQQIPLHKLKSSEGSYFNKIFLRYMQSENPLAVFHSLLEGDRGVALQAAREGGLWVRGPRSALMIAMLLEHPKPRELCCALKLLDKVYLGELITANAASSNGRMYKTIFSSLYRAPHPFKMAAALQMLKRALRYNYNFELSDPEDGLTGQTIYFSRDAYGFLDYSMVCSREIVLHEKLPIQVPSPLEMEYLQTHREVILDAIDERGHLDYHQAEWHNYLIKELFKHSMPYSLAIMISKFNDTNCWEDAVKMKFIHTACRYSPFWFSNPEFFHLFLQMPMEKITSEFVNLLTDISLRIQADHVLARMDEICAYMKRHLDVVTEALPPACQPAPYINLRIQQEVLIRRFPQSQSDLFDVNQYTIQEYFESPIRSNP